jgi:hypothetical protein
MTCRTSGFLCGKDGRNSAVAIVILRRIGAAKKAWGKITTDPDTVIAAEFVFSGARQNEDPKFTPHAATWLNAGRWDDEPDPQGFRAKSSTQDSWEALQRGAQYLDAGMRAF